MEPADAFSASGPQRHRDQQRTSSIPELVFAMFQGKFAIIAPALIAGAFAERVRFRGYCIFIALWGLVVYCPLAHWVWSGTGFLLTMGAQDYAGGTVVHISAGVSALVCAIYLGARKGYPQTAMRPNNLVMTLIGAGLLWVGWFGFNAGSSLSSNFDTVRALTVTQAAAADGGIDVGHHRSHSSSQGNQSRAVLGNSGRFGGNHAGGGRGERGWRDDSQRAGVAGLLCRGLDQNTSGLRRSLDVFGIHGVAGIFGAMGLSVLLRPQSAAELTLRFGPDWSITHQLLVQGSAVGIAIIYAAVVSLILVLLVEKTVGFRLDITRETAGLDHALHGEHGYGLLNLQ